MQALNESLDGRITSVGLRRVVAIRISWAFSNHHKAIQPQVLLLSHLNSIYTHIDNVGIALGSVGRQVEGRFLFWGLILLGNIKAHSQDPAIQNPTVTLHI